MKMVWKEKPLGELCQIELGKTPSRGNKSLWDTEKTTTNVWLSIADLLNGEDNIITDSKEYVSDKGAKVCKVVKSGTLLVSFKLTLGRLAFAGRDLFTNEAIAALTFKNENELSKEFLYYYLSFFDWNAATEGDFKIKGRTLNKAKLKEIAIRFPESLPEQQRIVSVLDEAFASIAQAKSNAERNLVNARELFESVLQSSFENVGKDWEVKKFGELYSFKNGINFDKTQKIGKGILTIDVLNMYNEGTQVDLSQLYRVNKEVSGEYILKNGDILIVRSSVKKEGVAWATFFRETDEPITFCGFIIRGRPIEKINPEYIVHFLRSSVTREKLIKTATQSTITNINQQNLSQLIVPVPPLAEQRAIVGRLEALSAETGRLEEIYQQKIESLEELKKSVLARAFNGEL